MNETTFPRTKEEALALIYVQAQDLTDVTPEELLSMYNDAYTRIAAPNERVYKEI